MVVPAVGILIVGFSKLKIMNKNWWFGALSIIAGALAGITIHPLFAVLGLAVAIGLIIWDYLNKERADQIREELCIEITPQDWTITKDQGMAVDAELVIREARHGKGRDINVRIRQTGLKRWDLEEHIIEDGDIVIRYARNNFPQDPRIALHVYISGRA